MTRSPEPAFWRLYARIYDWTWDNSLSSDLAAEVSSRVVPGVCVEVGSGTGLTTRFLLDRASMVVSVDRSASMLRRAPRPLRCVLVQGDAAELPLADGVAGTVVAVNVVQFLSRPDAALREFRRVAGTGGTVIVTRPAPNLHVRTAVREIWFADGLGAVLRFLSGHAALSLMRLLSRCPPGSAQEADTWFASAQPALGGLQQMVVLSGHRSN